MNFNVQEHGFAGDLYLHGEERSSKLLIVCGGSGGKPQLTQTLSKIFAKESCDTLALYYTHAKGLPKNTVEAPVESVENAVHHFLNNHYTHIGMYGTSAGGEYALLAASLIPEISLVIAVNAPTAISQGDSGIKSFETSAWSWKNKTFPYLETNLKVMKIIKNSIKHKELYIKDVFVDAILKTPKDAWIPLEKIQGDVFLFTAEYDSVCPSKQFAEIASKRFETHNFKYNYNHLNFEFASHFLLPLEPSDKFPFKLFKVERTFPKECQESRLQLKSFMLDILKKW